ncbi:UDP-4-amino-4,6-dideoxy-N-acetyl-beta-L-altrosamine transaminase [Fluviicola taffensis]|uniref:UDP-4-keto-6-deoxy-N-acetylglucosamine 4-aminotransferase n=1 Tax=Fluviicola taffensis (strain DSM 16823 / NCIMB 13979 / RW262) TaxID=755732 RepID=F2IBZ9_FLUTR|nr:UDP-4-amino-4,6-dideoxy-N-acetyl-beta-L-altrosamine transaminase [Fluviicola taffensis]AEA42227.1 UDP-4-keto-6-deoxy-N-acetylglucosamine 4-aminotransferase [Fluviicola taffensis DSM 16823]
MSKIIPYGRQEITQDDIQAVIETLQSDFLTQGPQIAAFEIAFATYVGSKYAIAVSNGTAALHLAVMALGIQEDEYVICTPITFAASINCVKYCGGQVLFADIDPETYLMDLESVKSVIKNNPDKKIRGIIPVDFAGRVPQLDSFRKFADEQQLWIIEDACHSPGGFFTDQNNQQQTAGNGLFAELSVFSFHPVKHIATGEGGMITTNDENLYQRLLTLRTHGITRNANIFENSVEFAIGNSVSTGEFPLWYMEMQELGYNYRITDFQAALGISQLKRAEQNLSKRRSIAQKYTNSLNSTPGIIHSSGLIEGHAYHLFILEVTDRKGLYDFLRKKGIYAQIHYIPVHLMPYYKKQGWKEGDLPHAENYYSRCISIPMFPSLKEDEIKTVISSIKEFYTN